MRPLFLSKDTHETRSCVLVQKIFILKIILHIKSVTNYRTYITQYHTHYNIQEEKKNDFYICRDNDRRNHIRHWRCGMGQRRNKEN